MCGGRHGEALAGTINGLYSAEVIHRRGSWKSCEAVECATLDWVDWFNHRRLLEPLGFIPPAEAEENYDATTAAMDNLAVAAQLKPTSLRQSRGGSLLQTSRVLNGIELDTSRFSLKDSLAAL